MPSARSARYNSGSRETRILAAGVMMSAVLHAAILMIPLHRPDRSSRELQLRSTEHARAQLEVIAVRTAVTPGSTVNRIGATSRLGADLTLRNRAPYTVTSPTPASSSRRMPSVRERLRPVVLPATVDLPRSATIEARARMDRDLRLFNDSIREVESRGTLTDWSTRSRDGQRWGLSPSTIHLGSRSVSPCKSSAVLSVVVGFIDPFNCQFRVSDAHRRDLRDRVELHREIAIRAAISEADQQIRARISAMNARKAAARDTMR